MQMEEPCTGCQNPNETFTFKPTSLRNKHRRDSLLTHFEEGEPLALVEDQVFVDEGRLCGRAVVTAQLIVLKVLQAQAENTASLRRTSERPQKHRETYEVHLAACVSILFILLLLLLQGCLQLLLLLPQNRQQLRTALQLPQLSGVNQLLTAWGGP